MMWIYAFQLFLFDFDGLLVNTEHLHYQAYVNMLAKRDRHLDWSFSDFIELGHLNSTAIRDAIYAKFPDLDPSWNLLYEEKKQAFMDLLASGKVELMPGVAELLQALQAADIRRCVVTNSPRDQIELIRSQIPILQTIPHWITREDYQKAKPDPDGYLRAIHLYGQPGDKIIGFEDSIRGLKALQGTPALPVLICPAHYPLLNLVAESLPLRYDSFNEIAKEGPLSKNFPERI